MEVFTYLSELQSKIEEGDFSFRLNLWMTFEKLIFVIYFIATVQLIPQIKGIIGERGVTPVNKRLAAYARDFPSWRRFFYYPTYLWISCTDTFMVQLLWIGKSTY